MEEVELKLTCKLCGLVGNIIEFSSVYGIPKPQCKKCNALKSKKFRDDDPKSRKRIEEKCKLKRYSLTKEQFEAMREKQENKCNICKKEFTGASKVFKPHIDHNHSCCPSLGSCGKCIRGLLCGQCNQYLGIIGDSPDAALRMYKYLLGESLSNE